MKNIFIGVDGGGTKTKVLIEDKEGNKIGEGLGGPSNICLSVENSWKSIYTAIDIALDGSGISLDSSDFEFYIGMGLAGISIIEAKTKFLSTPNPFKSLKLEADAHIACLGVNQGKDGAIISIGTGVIGYLIENKKPYRVSGYGFPHSCTGGGAWIGMEAVRLVFDWIDGANEGSKILEDIYKKFDCELSKIVQWANSANASQFATIAPFVVKGLEWKDKYSLQLFERGGAEISGNIKALRNKTEKSENIKCWLMGGLAQFVKDFIKLDNVEICEDKDAAVKGAIILARDSLTFEHM